MKKTRTLNIYGREVKVRYKELIGKARFLKYETVKESLPWRVHYKKGVTVTARSTQLALRRVFSTLHIGLFFSKVDKNIEGDYVNNEFMGFELDERYKMTG